MFDYKSLLKGFCLMAMALKSANQAMSFYSYFIDWVSCLLCLKLLNKYNFSCPFLQLQLQMKEAC